MTQQSDPIPGPFNTAIWVSRIENLKSHLRVIQRDGSSSGHPGMERMALQASAGIEEADRYLAEPNWDACPMSERLGA